MRKNIAIIAHGGAGGINHARRRLRGLKEAVREGYDILYGGGSSIDAVEKAAVILEDAPIFNAGTGSYLNLSGEVEMDASIMTGELKFGAVGVIRDVKNPISIARMVMEKTDHLLLCGDNAIKFARYMGMPYHDPKTREKELIWQRGKRKRESKYFEKIWELNDYFGTIGVVAIDMNGLISVATSSGGINLRLPGRVGDTPIIGAGTYADHNGGVSTTGHGEEIMRQLLAFRAVTLMSKSRALEAGKQVLSHATKSGCRCGMVGIDKNTNILCLNNTKAMSWCYIKTGRMRAFLHE
ncbi:MAG: isoaspartyl peptidase/L-asparaginase [candidate division WOR-3 bacterium]|nr:isoaspartyl peptidase/L-asparaginase [candidate division WOR-3 bacterium]